MMLKKIIISIPALAVIFLAHTALAALSCSVSTTCNSPDVVVLRMAGTSNSHAELPSQSNYSQLVCCGGVSGLANSCTNTYGMVLRLSSDTNAHVEESNQSTSAYNNRNACLSVLTGDVTIVYRDSNCSGYDTTVASISQTPTNAHIGNSSAYTRKICATASITSSSSSGGGGGGGGIGENNRSEEVRIKILKTANFNGDGRVGILDLSILLYYIDHPPSPLGMYDLNEDGILDFLDISVLFYYWDVF